MIGALEWLGARARYALILGCLAALLAPDLASAARPALPFMVALVYMLSMARIDLSLTVRGLLRPRRAALIFSIALGLLVGGPAVTFALGRALGLDDVYMTALVYCLASPPIASSATLCLLLGLDAAFALEVTVAACFLMPVVGPVVVHALLGVAAPIESVALGLRLAAMIFAGAAGAMILRWTMGAVRICRRKAAFDGVGVLTMILFAFAVFDGVGATILARPELALGMLALSAGLNWGPQLLAPFVVRRAPGAVAGAGGLTCGARSTAIYLAALPPDPLLSLFVALYQFPLYATPLVFGRFYARLRVRC